MDKRDYEEWRHDDLVALVESLDKENDELRKQIDDWSDAFADCEGTERILVGEIESLENRVAELEEQLESNGATKSRNFTIDNLYYLLVDRYGLSHHTSKDKLKALVDEELSL